MELNAPLLKGSWDFSLEPSATVTAISTTDEDIALLQKNSRWTSDGHDASAFPMPKAAPSTNTKRQDDPFKEFSSSVDADASYRKQLLLTDDFHKDQKKVFKQLRTVRRRELNTWSKEMLYDAKVLHSTYGHSLRSRAFSAPDFTGDSHKGCDTGSHELINERRNTCYDRRGSGPVLAENGWEKRGSIFALRFKGGDKRRSSAGFMEKDGGKGRSRIPFLEKYWEKRRSTVALEENDGSCSLLKRGAKNQGGPLDAWRHQRSSVIWNAPMTNMTKSVREKEAGGADKHEKENPMDLHAKSLRALFDKMAVSHEFFRQKASASTEWRSMLKDLPVVEKSDRRRSRLDPSKVVVEDDVRHEKVRGATR